MLDLAALASVGLSVGNFRLRPCSELIWSLSSDWSMCFARPISTCSFGNSIATLVTVSLPAMLQMFAFPAGVLEVNHHLLVLFACYSRILSSARLWLTGLYLICCG